jgi:hypothetical protein
MSNFKDLVRELRIQEDERWLKSVAGKTDVELAAIITHPSADTRQVSAAAETLRKRGVTGVPK